MLYLKEGQSSEQNNTKQSCKTCSCEEQQRKEVLFSLAEKARNCSYYKDEGSDLVFRITLSRTVKENSKQMKMTKEGIVTVETNSNDSMTP